MDNKKRNTWIFMVVATLVNIILMIACAFVGVLVWALFLRIFPESQTVMSLGLILVLVFALLGSFFIYNRLVAFVLDKFKLEDKMEPIFRKKSRKAKNREEEQS